MYVLPTLREYDLSAFRAAVKKSNWPHADFQEPFTKLGDELLLADWNSQEWDMYQVWALTRATGRIPLPCFGGDSFPTLLDQCPLCGAMHADLCHLLFKCESCTFERSLLRYKSTSWSLFRSFLFAGDAVFDDDGRPATRIRYVYDVMEMLSHEIVKQ